MDATGFIPYRKKIEEERHLDLIDDSGAEVRPQTQDIWRPDENGIARHCGQRTEYIRHDGEFAFGPVYIREKGIPYDKKKLWDAQG